MGILPHQTLHRLDSAAFWDIEVWDFSFRSLAREYAWLFFLKALVPHPLRTARGLRRYRRFVRGRRDRAADYARIVAIPDDAALAAARRTSASRPLLGLGFCLKPADSESALQSCPSGRANHDCLYLERGEARPVCADCAIFRISRRAFEKGCAVYIMTSAKDIARDFMIPQIKKDLFPSAVLLLCPFSIQAIIPPLLICGVDALLIPYARGSCADYAQWLRADKGIKDERTELSAEAERKVRDVLGRLGRRQPPPRSFRRRGNIFYPG